MSEEFDEAYWEDRYRGTDAPRQHGPNSPLMVEVADLPPGRALDAGCGGGADAVWLASRGWRVTAVDVATTALERAEVYAAAFGPEVAERVEWQHADLTTWTPPLAAFDLVTSSYVHPAGSLDDLVQRLAAAVAPGGTLLLVTHHASGDGAHAHGEQSHATAEDLAAVLDPEAWKIVVADTRPRVGIAHEGHELWPLDVVVRARRRR